MVSVEKRVRDVIYGIDAEVIGNPDEVISGIEIDSKRVNKGKAFITIKGGKFDATSFVRRLYFSGCNVFVLDDPAFVARERKNLPQATFVKVRNCREVMPKIAKNFWGEQKAKLIGVTGTKGKTSTVKIISNSLALAGIRCGAIGSVWWKLTTPEVLDTLRIVNQSNFEYFAMEVTSISVVQRRIDELEFLASIFLGLGHDHLDFHKTVENYFLAKYSFIKRAKEIIIIFQDEWGKRAFELLSNEKYGAKVYTFDHSNIKFHDGKFELTWKSESIKFIPKFFGYFNGVNFVASYILLRELGFTPWFIKDLFEEIKPPPGRMELVWDSPRVFVDYAHNPESLENSISECIRLKDQGNRFGGKVFVVFGCGGSRDKEKRPRMGKIAFSLADRIFITSDNPRDEEPASIVADILVGIMERTKIPEVINTIRNGDSYDDGKVCVELDRRRAIFKALKEAERGDIILIAGKGHEEYQIVGDKVLDFSDRRVVQEFFNSSCGGNS